MVDTTPVPMPSCPPPPAVVSLLKACTRVGFSNLEILFSCSVDIDKGTLVFACILLHNYTFNAGNYMPAVGEFQRQIISMTLHYKLNYTLVLDIQLPKEKRHDHQRRHEREISAVVDATFIAICVRICKRHFVRFIVAPAEADM